MDKDIKKTLVDLFLHQKALAYFDALDDFIELSRNSAHMKEWLNER